MKKILTAVFLVILVSSFDDGSPFKGTWQYLGGIYNGKKEGPPEGYTLERKYDDMHFSSFALEKGAKAERYETGDYSLKGDTCIEVQTYSSQPTKLKNIAVKYVFTMRHDSLIFKGTLPTGMQVEEYWRRKK